MRIRNRLAQHGVSVGVGSREVSFFEAADGVQHVKRPATLGDDDELLAVNEALDKLAIQNQLEADLVKLRYFVGMTLEEAAEVLGISARTADNYWAHARAWLYRAIKAQRQ